MKLTRNGWTFVVLSCVCFLMGLLLDYVELIMLAFVFLLNLAFAVAWLARRPSIEVQRDVTPTHVAEGEGAAGVLVITNTGHRRSPPIVAVERFVDREIAVVLSGLGAGAHHSINYPLPTEKRGCYTVGPLLVGHSDPLCLVSVKRSYGAEVTLWVHPRIHRVSPVPTGHAQDLEGPTSAGAPRGGIAFHSLREYVPGDDLRLIHWRSSVRLNTNDTGNLDTLMVRHTVITNEPKILVILDTSAQSYAADAFEDAVRAAASLVVASATKHFPTEFRTTGGISGYIDPVGIGWADVLDKLAAVQSSHDDPGLQGIAQYAARRKQGVALGVVTGQPPLVQAESVGKVRSRFQMVTLVQVGEQFDRPPISISGVLGLNASTSEDFARKWKARFGS